MNAIENVSIQIECLAIENIWSSKTKTTKRTSGNWTTCTWGFRCFRAKMFQFANNSMPKCWPQQPSKLIVEATIFMNLNFRLIESSCKQAAAHSADFMVIMTFVPQWVFHKIWIEKGCWWRMVDANRNQNTNCCCCSQFPIWKRVAYDYYLQGCIPITDHRCTIRNRFICVCVHGIRLNAASFESF